MKSPTLRSTRSLCGRPEGVRPNDVRPLQQFRNLSWASVLGDFGGWERDFAFLVSCSLALSPKSQVCMFASNYIHNVLRFSQTTLSSCSLPTSRRIWATCPLHFLFCALSVELFNTETEIRHVCRPHVSGG